MSPSSSTNSIALAAHPESDTQLSCCWERSRYLLVIDKPFVSAHCATIYQLHKDMPVAKCMWFIEWCNFQ